MLYDRLLARGYGQKKLQENVEAEIMQVVLQETRDSYAAEIINEVRSDTVDDMEKNVENVKAWLGMNIQQRSEAAAAAAAAAAGGAGAAAAGAVLGMMGAGAAAAAAAATR